MPPAFHPGPDWYIAFHDFNPSTDRQCIYYTQGKQRCSWPSNDNGRAIQLHRLIRALPRGTLNLDFLIEYVLCCCCMRGRAKHRLRIEDRQELLPLAERWLEESQRIAAPAPLDNFSAQTSEDGDDGDRVSNSTTPPTTPPSFEASQSSTILNRTPQRSTDSLEHLTADAVDTTIHSTESQHRYNLRQSNSTVSTNSITSLASIYRAPQTEFAMHVTSPGLDASRKLLEPLLGKDFSTGSLYIFDRASSHGHVKIGYTTSSVAGRLAAWSKCGYRPQLAHEVGGVPWVKRAETLTHHELIKEWRRERRCNHARGCARAHQEWFETSREKAARVVGGWANFMKRARPYDATGRLKPRWIKFVNELDVKGEVVTAKVLLEQYEAALAESKALPKQLAALVLASKGGSVEEADIKANVKSYETAVNQVAPQLESSTWLKDEPMSSTFQLNATSSLPKTQPENVSLFESSTSCGQQLANQSSFASASPFVFGALKTSSTTSLSASEGQPTPKLSSAGDRPFKFEVNLPATTPSFFKGEEQSGKTSSFMNATPFTFRADLPVADGEQTHNKFFFKSASSFKFGVDTPVATKSFVKPEPQSKPIFSFTGKAFSYPFGPSTSIQSERTKTSACLNVEPRSKRPPIDTVRPSSVFNADSLPKIAPITKFSIPAKSLPKNEDRSEGKSSGIGPIWSPLFSFQCPPGQVSNAVPLLRAQTSSKPNKQFKFNLPLNHLPLEVNLWSTTEPFAKSDCSNQEESTRSSIHEDLPPEQISLPPSPLLSPETFSDDACSIGAAKWSSSATSEENGADSDSEESPAVTFPGSKIDTLTLTRTQNKPVADPGSLLVTGLSEALLDLQVRDQEEIAALSGEGEKAITESLITAEIEDYTEDHTTIADDGHEEKDESWSDDLTLVEADQIPSVELAALKIVDEPYHGISSGKASGVSKALEIVTILETELQPAVSILLP
jgi:hypothetical protein